MPDTIDSLVHDLNDEDRSRRAAAEDSLVALGAQVVDHLLPILRLEPRDSRYLRAESVLSRLGDEAVQRLREIRRDGPGRLRSVALRVMTDSSGEAALDEADRRAVERLVRIKLLSERPVMLPPESRWLAFPADRLDAVVAGLGLHDLRAATAVMGLAATEATSAHDSITVNTPRGEDETAYRVFITPGFSNWRLLYGNSFLDDLGGEYVAEKASEQCGEAHFYSVDTFHDAHVWCVARDGVLVRRHATWGDPEWEGEPLPFELDYIEGRVWIDPSQADADGVTDANVAARHLSVDVGFMPASGTQGHGWLATTHPAVLNSRFKGALPI
ncbi:hypothetical protein [Streptomyces gibsoniae]|uniref:HEAT repeat domain-containing protein n=1 Tax=Streptomyces gibsoniae TaxID=3075529 RepID=A0ABU2U5T0_9ACTN|nr:hypothetical protein [Streptomyces sp. DSM 41699]MDT0468589.1 hypothetical protein [Streptomyces sp. DSM 41699]